MTTSRVARMALLQTALLVFLGGSLAALNACALALRALSGDGKLLLLVAQAVVRVGTHLGPVSIIALVVFHVLPLTRIALAAALGGRFSVANPEAELVYIGVIELALFGALAFVALGQTVMHLQWLRGAG